MNANTELVVRKMVRSYLTEAHFAERSPLRPTYIVANTVDEFMTKLKGVLGAEERPTDEAG